MARKSANQSQEKLIMSCPFPASPSSDHPRNRQRRHPLPSFRKVARVLPLGFREDVGGFVDPDHGRSGCHEWDRLCEEPSFVWTFPPRTADVPAVPAPTPQPIADGILATSLIVHSYMG